MAYQHEQSEPSLQTSESRVEKQPDPRIGQEILGIFGNKIVPATVVELRESDGSPTIYIQHGDMIKTVAESAFDPEVQAALARQKAEQDIAAESLNQAGVAEPLPEAATDVASSLYDRLLNPNDNLDDFTVEDAAVKREPSDDEKWIEENIRRKARTDALNEAIHNRADDYRSRHAAGS